MNKIKIYNIILSRVFPYTHPKAGEQTGFKDKLFYGLDEERDDGKIHTIRANYDYWKKKFEEIARGEAVLNIRQWIGRPYRSKTQILVTLRRDDGIGLQKLTFTVDDDGNRVALIDGVTIPSLRVLANNDGLSLNDWIAWFESYEKNKPMAIIHFTPFRY